MSNILSLSSDFSLQSFESRNFMVSRVVKIYRFEPHPNRKEIIVVGDTAISVVDCEMEILEGPRIEDFQKHILLVGLNKTSDVEKVATNILALCPCVDLELRDKLKETLHEIIQREYNQCGQVVYPQVAYDGTKLPRFPEIFDDFDFSPKDADCRGDAEAQFERLDQYVELLYEDTGEKIEATRMIGKLTRCTGYLYKIVKHESVVNALFRTLREDCKKSTVLTKNILSILLDFAKFREFHGILLCNKIPQITLDIIDFELERCEKWKLQLQKLDEEASNSGKDSAIKAHKECRLWACFDERVASQNSLLKVAFELLHFLTENKSVRESLLDQNVVTSLVDCLERREKELLDIVLHYLRDLSCFRQAIDGMLGVDITFKLAEVLKGGFPLPKTAVHASFHLLFNISFHTELRTKVIKNGLVGIVSKCLPKQSFMKICVRLMYLISMDPAGRNKLTKQSIIFPVLDHLTSINHNKIPVEPGCLMANLALNRRCADIVAEYTRLPEFIENAIKHEDILAMKVLRNLAENGFAYVLSDNLGDIAKATRKSTSQDFLAECIGTLACFDPSNVDIKVLTENGKIFGWLKQTLAYYLEHVEDSPLHVSSELVNSSLDALNFLKTLCGDENGARLIFGDIFSQLFVRILQSPQIDRRILQQILGTFFTATKHISISVFLALKTRVPHGLLKFAEEIEDKQLKRMCMSSLQNIANSNDTWKELLKEHNFLEWNNEWVERIASGEEVEDSSGSSFHPLNSEGTGNYAYYAESSDNSDTDDLESESESSRTHPDTFFDMFRQQYDEEMEQKRRRQYFESVMLHSATPENDADIESVSYDLSDSDTD